MVRFEGIEEVEEEEDEERRKRETLLSVSILARASKRTKKERGEEVRDWLLASIVSLPQNQTSCNNQHCLLAKWGIMTTLTLRLLMDEESVYRRISFFIVFI